MINGVLDNQTLLGKDLLERKVLAEVAVLYSVSEI